MATVRTGAATNPYSRLGLAPGAPLDDVKRAYRRLSMRYHPDRAGTEGVPAFLAVQAAYRWIIAHPSVAEPGDRRPTYVYRATVAPTDGHATPSASRRPAVPVARSSWPGGRWYWEGIRERAARLRPEDGCAS